MSHRFRYKDRAPSGRVSYPFLHQSHRNSLLAFRSVGYGLQCSVLALRLPF